MNHGDRNSIRRASNDSNTNMRRLMAPVVLGSKVWVILGY